MRTNVVFQMDCLNGMKLLPKESVDMILTDPPYYLRNAKNIRLKNRKNIIKEFEFDAFSSEKEYLDFMRKVIQELYRVCKDGAAGYMFCSEEYLSYIKRILEEENFKFRGAIYWHKTNPFPAFNNRKMYSNSMELCLYFSKGVVKRWNIVHPNKRHNFMEYPNAGGKEKTKHKTQKPLRVCKHLIEMSSEANDLILDPFMGSGSTAIAALLLGRKFIGFEHNETYCKYIRVRFVDWIENNPVKIQAIPLVAVNTKLLFRIKHQTNE